MLLCNNSEMNNENEEELVVAKMNNDNEEQNNQVMLPVIDTSTRPSSSAVNNQIYATNSVIEELQVRNLQTWWAHTFSFLRQNITNKYGSIRSKNMENACYRCIKTIAVRWRLYDVVGKYMQPCNILR